MQWSDISFTPSSRVLRQFAALVLIVFGGLAVWYGVVRGQVGLATAFALVAAVIGPLGLIAPRAIRPIFVAWIVVAFPIGWTVSRVLLAVVFYGLFTPLGLAFRLIGRDRLQRVHRSERATYWTSKAKPTGTGDYFRQF